MEKKKKETETEEVKLKVKKSSAGLGLFADAPIGKGQFVIEYTGELIANAEADRRGGKYLFNINSKWTVDGKGRDNTARYINHSCKPNCEVETKGNRIFICAIKDIPAGEELSYDYGEEYFDELIKPAGCRCAGCRH
ncbi:MAG: SET domain-containing protein [Candidatus Moranbacteria bacterium]|nr:SET domain-containing protein [Candidatus Moranbacteria bacterium]